MAELRSGVLLKLLQQMCIDSNESDRIRKPVLLQIRSIIPVLAEGDLWPNQGFYLKLSDSSHAMYVSLPQEQDDMVLCNKLQIGQCIYVEKLEPAYPVPMLKDIIKPVPGRHPCLGDPKDLVSLDNLERFCGISQLKILTEEKINNRDHDGGEKWWHRERLRSGSSSTSLVGSSERRGRRRELIVSRKRDGESEYSTRCRRRCYGDKDSDCESNLSTLSVGSAASSSSSRRRSWNGEFPDNAVIKHEIKPIGRSSSSGSACVSSIQHSRYDSSDDNSISKPRRKDVGLVSKSAKSSNKSGMSALQKKDVKSLYASAKFDSTGDKKWAEAEILWDSLPSNLVKLGKKVLRERNTALLAAVEALQEASASQRLLKCLSTFSELQSSKEDDQLSTADRFFNLHKDLSQTRLILQSLTNISPIRSSETEQNDNASIKEQLRLGSDRKKNATSWIKAALASDLTPITSSPSKTKHVAEKKSSRTTTTHGGQTKKHTYIIKMHRTSEEMKDNKQTETWTQGSKWNPGAELVNLLQDESRSWFLGYMESYLDGVDLKSMYRQSNGEVAEMMCKIKRMNDWLDLIAKREGGTESCIGLQSSELEAYGRLRNKIYRILLKNVERTAMAFEQMKMKVMVED